MDGRPSTEELIGRVQAGEFGAMAGILDRYGARVGAFVRSRMGRSGGEHDPEDIVQETFVRAMERARSFRWSGEGLFFRWLCGIAQNLLANAVAKDRRRRQAPPPLPPVSTVPSPSRVLRREERLTRLEEAFRHLSSEQREVLRLARLEGLGYGEIAERLGRSPEAVRQIASRGIKRLREILEATESLSLPQRPLELGALDETFPHGPAEPGM